MLLEYLRQLEQLPALQEALSVLLSCWTARRPAVLVAMPARGAERTGKLLFEVVKRVFAAAPLVLEVSATTRPDELLQRLEAASGLMRGHTQITSPLSISLENFPAENAASSTSITTSPLPNRRARSNRPTMLPRSFSANDRFMSDLSRFTFPRDRADSIESSATGSEPAHRQLLRQIVIVRLNGQCRPSVSDLFNTFLTYGQIDYGSVTIHCSEESMVVFLASETNGVANIPKDLLDFCFLSTRISSESTALVSHQLHHISPIDTSIFSKLRANLDSIYMHPDVEDYIRNLILTARCNADISSTTSANAFVNLVAASRLRALLAGCDYVSPDHVQSVAFRVLRHRLFLLHHEEYAPQTLKDAYAEIAPDELLASILVDRTFPTEQIRSMDAFGVSVELSAELGPVPAVRMGLPLLHDLRTKYEKWIGTKSKQQPSPPQPKPSKSQKQKQRQRQKQQSRSGNQRQSATSADGHDDSAGWIGRPCKLTTPSRTVYARLWIVEFSTFWSQSDKSAQKCSAGASIWRKPTETELAARKSSCGADASESAAFLSLWPSRRLPRASRIVVDIVHIPQPKSDAAIEIDEIGLSSMPVLSPDRIAAILADLPVCAGCMIDDVFFRGKLLLRVCQVEAEISDNQETNASESIQFDVDEMHENRKYDGDVLVHRSTVVQVCSMDDQLDMLPDLSHLSISDQQKPPTTTENNALHMKLHGMDSVFDSLLEIVSFPIRYKRSLDKLGIQVPRAVLLSGPPGVGKTSVVAAVARACNANLFIIRGSVDIFGSYLGESEERLRVRFTEATEASQRDENRPCILFMDEIDALAPKREESSRESSVVAQLLTLMDGVESKQNRNNRLVVIGATNRPGAIDPALRRPGRFDREIMIDAPTESVRLEMIRGLTQNLPLADEVDLGRIASATRGFVGADLSALCREATLLAVFRDSQSTSETTQVNSETESAKITHDDFETALARSGGASLARGTSVNTAPTSWDSIGGLDHVKHKLRQCIEWPLAHRATFTRLGLKPPRGVLLYGPPGCSKTTMARAIASSACATFFSIHGAALYSPYVGESERIIRSVFQRARATAPAVVFIDEVDTLVGKRALGDGGSGGDVVQERILSSLLNEMDGIESANGVLVLGATNRPDMIDAALLRPGRFDRVVYVPPPTDAPSRLSILQVHTRGMPLAPCVNLDAIASDTSTAFFTGADLGNVCREAALCAIRDQLTMIEQRHFEHAVSVTIPTLSHEMLDQYAGFAQKLGG